ncbi:MAG TPA: hypothetical protein VGS20_15880 [Candidatus Acidoferrales bacterium]|nr:hypothetical protein [Candidatus Acidoferrales bacterium]
MTNKTLGFGIDRPAFPRTGRRAAFGAATLALAALAFAAPAAAQAYTASTANEAPPAELAAEVRAALGGQAIQVKSPAGVLCELWLRQTVPAVVSPGQTLGVVYNQIAPGTLVGAVRFPAQVVDFRNQKVKPGVYTLRYELNPVDGNHQGVAPDRDFLLLVPAASDASTAPLEFNDLAKLSRLAAGTGHPSVWCLVDPGGAPSQVPAVAAQDSDNGAIQVLFFQANFQAGAAAKPAVMGLVVVGTSSAA